MQDDAALEEMALNSSLLPPRVTLVNITPRTVATVLLTAVIFAGLLYLLWQMRTILRWTIIAIFLAVALNPAVRQVERLRVPRGIAILIVYLLLLLSLAGLVAAIVPPVIDQGGQLIDYAIRVYNDREGLMASVNEILARYNLQQYAATLQSQLSSLPGRLASAAAPLLAVTTGIVGSLYSSLTILLLTFFLLLDGQRFVTLLLRLMPPGQRARARRVLGKAAGAINGYITGNLVISLIAGVSSFIMLVIIRMPYPVILALIVALFDLIPLVGATLGATIVVAIGFFSTWQQGVALLIFFIVYQQIENNLLQPLVYGRSVNLHPLAVFVAVLAGGDLLGILGALLAIPVAEIIRILFNEWLLARARHEQLLAAQRRLLLTGAVREQAE